MSKKKNGKPKSTVTVKSHKRKFSAAKLPPRDTNGRWREKSRKRPTVQGQGALFK